MALTIKSSFAIAAPPPAAWAILTDIERAAPCFPGAQLQGRNDDGSWRASFGVKLGPMAFSFAGKFSIALADEAAGHVVVRAQGSDTKGRGGANANVDVQLAAEGGGTKVDITSAVDLSGSVAQFGRGAGMIQALSKQLVDQFAVNLRAAIDAQEMAQPVTAGAMSAVGQPAAPQALPAATLDAGSLMWRALLASLRGWFTKRFNVTR
ncbi:hypothetical protein BH11PSE7_BH11PSE7_32430 [soil metagenome]